MTNQQQQPTNGCRGTRASVYGRRHLRYVDRKNQDTIRVLTYSNRQNCTSSRAILKTQKFFLKMRLIFRGVGLALPSPTSHFVSLNSGAEDPITLLPPPLSLVVDPSALGLAVSVYNNPIKASAYSFFCLMISQSSSALNLFV